MIERWSDGADCKAGDVVFSPSGRQAYLACEQNKILVLQPESAACSPPQSGLAMLFAADDTTSDDAGLTELTPHGNPGFAPGRVGQAFFLDGSSYLSTSWTGSYQFDFQEATLGLCVKFADLEGEATLVDWIGENPRRGVILLKSAGNRLVFHSWPKGAPLYINGKPESHGTPPPALTELVVRSLFLGAQAGRPSFHGWLDEIAFYNRALTAKEADDLYRFREAGPCRL